MESLIKKFLSLNSGSGSGSGDGDGLISFNGNSVYYIDNIPTVIYNIKGFIASGIIINSDLTTRDVFVVRVGNYFAHGETLKGAKNDAKAKHLQNSPVEYRIDLFLEEFTGQKSIPAKSLFDWHFNLTGSCSFGRESFVSQNGIDLNKDLFSIEEFIELTRNSYGSNVILELEKKYKQIKQEK